MQETFCFNMSKQPSKKKSNSVIENKRQLNNLYKDKRNGKDLSKLGKSSELNPRNRKGNFTQLSKIQIEEEEDLSDIRYQLK